jgi:branched-subunit amino acid aminotransferase/4-amino-4-deoxychorismate lyase
LQKEDYWKGFRAVISKHFRQNEFSPLSGIKSANYLPMLLAYRQAKAQGYDEALLLNTQGFLSEASRSNIFFVKDNCLITPSSDCGCLPGITRDTVLSIAAREKIQCLEAKVSPEELKKADEAFLTNSLVEVMPLVAADGRPILKGKPGKITELILKRYRSLILNL